MIGVIPGVSNCRLQWAIMVGYFRSYCNPCSLSSQVEQIFQRSVKPILQSTILSALFLAIYLQSALRLFKFGGFITPRRINSYKFYRIVSLRCCVYQSIKYHRVSSGETSTVPGESPSGEQAIGRNIRIPMEAIHNFFYPSWPMSLYSAED